VSQLHAELFSELFAEFQVLRSLIGVNKAPQALEPAVKSDDTRVCGNLVAQAQGAVVKDAFGAGDAQRFWSVELNHLSKVERVVQFQGSGRLPAGNCQLFCHLFRTKAHRPAAPEF